MVKIEKDSKVGLGKGIKKKGKLQDLAEDDGAESEQEDKEGEKKEKEEKQAGEQKRVKVKEMECLSRLVAGTFGLVAAPLAVHHMNPMIIDDIGYYIAGQ
ncbi:MAG: hypothetical protein Q9180_006236 [Flavoplaca navasiana]